MAKYIYPAIFTPEDGGYSVEFPDIDGCFTCGDDLDEALCMAEDALALMLYHYEQEKRPIPESTAPGKVSVPDGSFVNYVRCDTLGYQKMNNNKAVKKTLTLPEWLNEAATAASINFSQVLQDALKEKLHMM